MSFLLFLILILPSLIIIYAIFPELDAIFSTNTLQDKPFTAKIIKSTLTIISFIFLITTIFFLLNLSNQEFDFLPTLIGELNIFTLFGIIVALLLNIFSSKKNFANIMMLLKIGVIISSISLLGFLALSFLLNINIENINKAFDTFFPGWPIFVVLTLSVLTLLATLNKNFGYSPLKQKKFIIKILNIIASLISVLIFTKLIIMFFKQQ